MSCSGCLDEEVKGLITLAAILHRVVVAISTRFLNASKFEFSRNRRDVKSWTNTRNLQLVTFPAVLSVTIERLEESMVSQKYNYKKKKNTEHDENKYSTNPSFVSSTLQSKPSFVWSF